MTTGCPIIRDGTVDEDNGPAWGIVEAATSNSPGGIADGAVDEDYGSIKVVDAAAEVTPVVHEGAVRPNMAKASFTPVGN